MQYEKRGKDGHVEVMSAWARIDRPNQAPLRTHLLMWTGKGVIWKLRTTFPDAERGIDEPAVRALGDALVDLSREAP